MNEVRLQGEIVRAYTGTSQKGNAWALFTVKVESVVTRNGEMSHQYIQCKSFGEVASTIAELGDNPAGTPIKVLGTLRSEAKKDKKEFVMDTRGYKVMETFVDAKAVELNRSIDKVAKTESTTTIPF